MTLETNFVAERLNLSWQVPRWAYVSRLWSQLDHILNPKSLTRIVFITTTVSVLVILGCRWLVPQMVLPNLWPMALSLPALVLTSVVQLGVLTLIRPNVTIRSDKILVQHGQSTTIIGSDSVTATRLVFHPGHRIRLRISYTKKSKPKSGVLGVPMAIDLNDLSKSLPVAPAIRDVRNRSRQPGCLRS